MNNILNINFARLTQIDEFFQDYRIAVTRLPENKITPLDDEPVDGEPVKTSDNYVRSFARGLEVIKSFSSEHPEQTLTEVAANSGLTRAGARRILLTLVNLGYVENEGRLFRLTPKILDLGFAYLSSMPFWDVAEPIVETLVQEVKEGSSISTLDGTDVVYVLRVPTRKIMTVNISIGSRLPAALTSMGRVLLSGLDDQSLDTHLQAFLAKQDSGRATPASFQELRNAILTVRKQGWALVNQELEAGLISIAAPIYGRNNRIIAAINVFSISDYNNSEDRMKAMLPSLLKAAERITQLTTRRPRMFPI